MNITTENQGLVQSSNIDCAICLEDFNGRAITTTKCQHKFHQECLYTKLTSNN